jgi:hypothetical protein
VKTTVGGKRLAVFFKYDDECDAKGNPKRYVTCLVCPERTSPDQKVEPIAVGAVCSSPESYVKTKLRNRALAKTLKKAGFDRATRTQIWNQFNTRHRATPLLRQHRATQRQLALIEQEMAQLATG